MPRLPRLHVPGGCYHVILRGNHQEDLFHSIADRRALDEITAEALARHGSRLHAYCWMSNHLHLLMQIGVEPLGKLVQRIAVRFSRMRHRQMRKTGHLFERRHRAWLVDADEYFVALLRYIHLNPVRAGIVRWPEDYAWSSHRAYLGEESTPWVTTEFGLSILGRCVATARHAYRQLMAQPSFASEEEIFGNVHPEDARVLGSDRFIASLPMTMPAARSSLNLEELALEVCQARNVRIDQLKSSARGKQLTDARLEIARRAIAGRIASMSQIAIFLCRNRSSLSELLERHRDEPSEHTNTGTY
jgi:putative transposase